MGKIFKWTGIGLLGLASLVLLVAVGLYATTSQRLNRSYMVPDDGISVTVDQESLTRGQRLVIARCGGCHGINSAGTVIFQNPMLGVISAANLTAGRGIGGVQLQDADYVAAIRHGVNHAGSPILTMPSEYYYDINDQELGEMIAYLKSTASIENSLPATRITPLGIALIGAGAFGDLIAAEKIDHQAARPAAVRPGITVAYGDYLVQTGQCRTCHGADLAGGKENDPNAPPAPDLTRGGELANWKESDFTLMFRTGRTPTGHQIDPNMPWQEIGQMTDGDLRAMWLYLQSLPTELEKE